MKGKNVCAMVPEDLALGLSLAGVSDIFVHDRSTGREEMSEWMNRKMVEGVGLIILSRQSSEMLSRELFDHRMSGEILPIMVVIPGEEEDGRARDLIKRAIGMDPGRTQGFEDNHTKGEDRI